jgi:hypothetical protein
LRRNEIGPTSDRHGCAFITSGPSISWDDDQPDVGGVSGLGIDLRIDNPADAHWCKDVMLRLSMRQLLIAGRMTGGCLLGDGDESSWVRRLRWWFDKKMTALHTSTTERVRLACARFQILQLFAITEAEQQHAERHGADPLLSLLKQKTTFPMNHMTRALSKVLADGVPCAQFAHAGLRVNRKLAESG